MGPIKVSPERHKGSNQGCNYASLFEYQRGGWQRHLYWGWEVVILYRTDCTISEKSYAVFSLGDELIWNVISIRSNAPFHVNQWQWFIIAQEAYLLVHFKKGTLPLIEIPFQIGSPPNSNRNFFCDSTQESVTSCSLKEYLLSITNPTIYLTEFTLNNNSLFNLWYQLNKMCNIKYC